MQNNCLDFHRTCNYTVSTSLSEEALTSYKLLYQQLVMPIKRAIATFYLVVSCERWTLDDHKIIARQILIKFGRKSSLTIGTM